MLYKNNTVRFYWNNMLDKEAATFMVVKGLLGTNSISL